MDEGGLTRRAVLRDGAAVTVAVMAAGALPGDVAVALAPGEKRFLDEAQLRTLRAAVDVFVPADQDPGAVAAGCAEAIDALLGAFRRDPPRIYAGAPFSDRNGAKVNSFKRFLPLDAYEARGWRLRIEGSKGRARNEFNGPVDGWQATYREGLKALDELSGGDFAARSATERDQVLRGSDPRVRAFVDIAWPHTWQFIYGAPEYGGNKDLIGWGYTVYDGDVNPRGWTRAEVEAPADPASAVDLVSASPIPFDDLLELAAMGASAEAAHVLLSRTDGTQSALAAELKVVRRAP